MNTFVDTADATHTPETQVIDLDGLHLPPDSPLPEGQTLNDVLRDARRFHNGDPSISSVIHADLLPAVMHTLRRPELIRTDYPLVLLPEGKVQPLVEFFESCIEDIDDSKILSDNLVRVEKQVRIMVKDVSDAVTVIDDAGAAIADSLNLNDKANSTFRSKGAELVQRIPAGTKLVPCSAVTGPAIALHLLEAETQNNKLRADAISVRDALRSLNSKESSVHVHGIVQAKLQEILSKTASGSVPIDGIRAKRINNAIKLIEHWLLEDISPLIVIRSEGAVEFTSPPCAKVIDAHDELCQVACKTYDDIAEQYAPLFGAMRTARLELANAYESPRHDHLLENFTRKNFSNAELACMPKIIGIGTVGDGVANMASLSSILRSSRPITLVLLGDDLTSLDHERIELAYLAVAHRKAFASQVSIARPSHLVDSISIGINSLRPTLHTVASEVTHPLGAWLEGNAAIEGRACPLLRYNPSCGTTWADRFDLVDNPQIEHDWPIWKGEVEGKDLELSFTFAHCALLNPDMFSHFLELPDGLESDRLVPIEHWLHLSPEEQVNCLPYLWAADIEGAIHRLVVSLTVTDVCLERLDYWRTLRELAGVDNEYVRRALSEERESLTVQLDALRVSMLNEHKTEIAMIRTTASQVAMQQLAQVLLSGGHGMINPMASLQSAAPPMQAAPSSTNGAVSISEAVSTEDPVESEPASEDLGEPWIDSPICTTCNDCMGINAQVFAYNEDKQAYIKDATAGTFDEIVRAAEVCPARCIHPGSPLNPSESGIEDLIKRAVEFN